MNKQLDSAVRSYHETGEGFDAIVSDVAIAIYLYPKRNPRCTEEDCAEFLLSFYPRIPALVSRYRDLGSDFKTYLQSCLRWHMRSYICRRLHGVRKERILLQEGCLSCAEIGEGRIPEENEEPEAPFLISPNGRLKNKRNIKQLIFLVMKCANTIGDPSIEHVAALTGIHRDVIHHLVEALRISMSRRTERIRLLEERRSRNYFRIRLLREERKNCSVPLHMARLDRKISREQKNYATNSRLLARVPKAPSHSDIARILGMPKGSVDSGFHYLKKYVR